MNEVLPKSWTRKSTKGVQKSMGKELFSEELKLAVVQYVLEGHTRKEASEKFCVSCTPIEKWVNLYKLHGAKGLVSRNLVGRQKGFDGEFRLKVLQYKQEHHLALLSRLAIAKLLHEKVSVDPPGDGQIALLTEFSVELVDHLVGVGLGDAQLLGHFLHAHKVLRLHG